MKFFDKIKSLSTNIGVGIVIIAGQTAYLNVLAKNRELETKGIHRTEMVTWQNNILAGVDTIVKNHTTSVSFIDVKEMTESEADRALAEAMIYTDKENKKQDIFISKLLSTGYFVDDMDSTFKIYVVRTHKDTVKYFKVPIKNIDFDSPKYKNK